MLQLIGLGVGPLPLLDALNQLLQTYGTVLYWIWTVVFWIWVRKRPLVDLWQATLLFLLGIYAVSPGFGVQWLVWVVPFWCVVDSRRGLRYSLLASAFISGSYWQWGLNAKYGVESLTTNLAILTMQDLIGVFGVGILGIVTWMYTTHTAWKLFRLS